MNILNLFTKILISVLGTTLIIFISVIGINLYKTSHLVVSNAKQLASAEGEKQAKNVENKLNYTMDTVTTVASTFGSLVEKNKADRDLTNAILKKLLKDNPGFIATWTLWEPNAFDGLDKKYVGTLGHDKTGRYIPYWSRVGDKINLEPLIDYETPGPGDYYLLSKNSGEAVILNPYPYPIGGKEVLITSIVAPIKINGKFVGVAGVDISLDSIQKINNSIKLYKSGFGTMISNNGTIVAHKSHDLIGKNYYDLVDPKSVTKIKAAVKSGQAVSITDVSTETQKENYKVYTPIHINSTSTPWSLMLTIPLDEVKQESNALLTLSIIIGSIGIIVLSLAITWITKRLVKPILKIVDQIKQIAAGDLTIEKLDIQSKDEIGQLAIATNEMTSNTRTLIRDAASISDQVSSYSAELLTFTNEMGDGIEQVAATTEELASGSTEQAQHTGETLEKIQQVDEKVKEIYQYTTEMTSSSQITEDSSQKGIHSADQSIQQMKMIEEKVSSTVNVVKKLGEKSREISHILEVINGIASQTNLLALNAAIEAARAGEHGKGFAVVADEVKKLAEQSSESTNQISSIIENVLKETQEVEQAMSSVVLEVQSGSEVIDSNKQAFNEIAGNITHMVHQINKVTDASELIAHETKEVVKAIENISAISQESSAGSEELSATMEQQSASMQEINSMTNHLSQITESLNQSLSKFKY